MVVARTEVLVVGEQRRGQPTGCRLKTDARSLYLRSLRRGSVNTLAEALVLAELGGLCLCPQGLREASLRAGSADHRLSLYLEAPWPRWPSGRGWGQEERCARPERRCCGPCHVAGCGSLVLRVLAPCDFVISPLPQCPSKFSLCRQVQPRVHCKQESHHQLECDLGPR